MKCLYCGNDVYKCHSHAMCDQCFVKKLQDLPFIITNDELRKLGYTVSIDCLYRNKEKNKKGKGRYRQITYIKGYDNKIYFLRDSIIQWLKK